MRVVRDRFGLLWRPEHAAELWTHLPEIDVVEVIADDWFGRPRADVRALRTLAAQVPLRLHGVGLGAASTERVDRRRLDALARLVGEVEPETWSEHLAFVRGGGRELGALAAPPRRPETVEGAARNLELAARIVGTAPLVENVATLLDPPGSTMDEAAWTAEILDATGCRLLLDLHNLHANCVNLGGDAGELVGRVGVARVGEVHVAGGRWVGPNDDRRLLDDHLHDVPAPVFEALHVLGAADAPPLTVILERDDAWPGVRPLLAQLGRARDALAAGRAAAAVPA
jgi:uncharacterized protein (UPF0276 family)